MASSTKQTENCRKRNHKNAGRERKRKLRNNGSTPAFPIHVDKDQGAAQS